jgi:hypothetical protein
VYTYADDTTLIITADTIQDLQTLAQSELDSLIQYFHSNNLVPNPTKTNYTIFYPLTEQNHLQLKLQDVTLEHNTKAKLLGLIIQNKIKHDQTITNIIKKLQPVIQKLRYANKLLPTHMMRQQYYSQVYPHLIGSITVWGTSDKNKVYIQPLIRVQKKIVRIIKRQAPKSHTKPIMKELKILNLPNLYILRVCVEIHPYIHQTTQVNRPEHNHTYMWIAQIHDYPTRHSTQQKHYVPIPSKHSKKAKPTFSTAYLTQQYTEVWNTIPLKLRENRSLSIFKKELKSYLLIEQNRNTQ